MTFGQKIKILRIERGWSQEELAQKIGVTNQRVSKYETDINRPVLEVLKNLSRVFGVSVDSLLFDKIDDTSFKDRELFEYFQTADKFSNRQKQLVKDLIKVVAEKP
jgi:transcriptional regulator with XRE-family HTH domain